MNGTLAVAAAALVVAVAALTLAVLVMRQNADALRQIRNHRRAHEKACGTPDPARGRPDPDVLELRDRYDELATWAQHADRLLPRPPRVVDTAETRVPLVELVDDRTGPGTRAMPTQRPEVPR